MHTNSADRKNLATLTYLPDAEDASDRLVMSDEAFAPAEGDTVLAEVVENDEETVEALDITPVLGDAESQPMTRTFLYGDALQFGSNQGSWKQYARIAGSAPGASDDVNGYANADSRRKVGQRRKIFPVGTVRIIKGNFDGIPTVRQCRRLRIPQMDIKCHIVRLIKKKLYVLWLARRSKTGSYPIFYSYFMQVEWH